MIETGLKEKVVIVTGAATGIGRATALRFACEGARVAAWDVNAEGADALVRELTEAGGEAIFQRVDVSNRTSVEEAAAGVVARWGAIHVLINNAGILRDAMLVKCKEGVPPVLMSDEQFDAVIAVNLKGVFVCTRAVAPFMISGGGGVILNASSVVGLYGNFGQTNYVAAKSGVIGMTKVWARELGKYGIRVNAVAPGFISTAMTRNMPEKVLDRMRAGTPLRRLGEPADIARAVLFLAADEASFITGSTLSINGGQYMV